ncbi:MAG: cell wall hydrolase [Dokdonella sp.]
MKLAFLLWLASLTPQQFSDQLCLATTVYLEARSETAAGQMAVAEVAMRRRDQGRWGDSVCSVVESPGQFAMSTTNKGYVLRNGDAFAKAWSVAGHAIAMWDLPAIERTMIVPHADHFATVDTVSPAWMRKPPLATIGAHNFYRVN